MTQSAGDACHGGGVYSYDTAHPHLQENPNPVRGDEGSEAGENPNPGRTRTRFGIAG
jgi:hypothetical protein